MPTVALTVDAVQAVIEPTLAVVLICAEPAVTELVAVTFVADNAVMPVAEPPDTKTLPELKLVTVALVADNVPIPLILPPIIVALLEVKVLLINDVITATHPVKFTEFSVPVITVVALTLPDTLPVKFPTTLPITLPVTFPETFIFAAVTKDPVKFPVTFPVKFPVTLPTMFVLIVGLATLLLNVMPG